MRDELWIFPLNFVLQLLHVLREISRFESKLRVVVDVDQRLWVERILQVDAVQFDFDGQLLQDLGSIEGGNVLKVMTGQVFKLTAIKFNMNPS